MPEDIDPESLPDYDAITIPEDKPPEEYQYNERRAEILKLVREKGDPQALDQYRLAGRYGVSQAQISKDMKRIRTWIAHNLDTTKARAFSQTAYRKCIRELMDQNEFGKAARAIDSWNNWLAEESVRDPEPEKQEVEHTGDVDIRIGGEPLDDGS